MTMHFRDGEWVHDGCLCQFGIGEAIAGLAVSAGIDATVATVGADALLGAGIGAAGAGITGGNPLTGALTGGLTGGAVGAFGGIAGDALGSATAGDALVGAGAGAAGAGLTGQNPVTGAVEGGLGGAVAGGLSGGAPGAPAPSGGLVGGAGASASGIAAPPGIGDSLGAGGGVLDAATQGVAGPIQVSGGSDVLGAAGGGSVSGGGSPGAPGAPGPVGDAAPGGTPSLGNSPDNAFNALVDVQGNSVVPPIPPGQGGAAGGGIGNALQGAGNFLSRNQWLLPAATIGYDALKSGQGLGNVPGYSQLNAQAGQLGAQATQLEGYLASGTLPPGVQTSLDQAGKAAIATIKSQYASRGMSGSSAEAQDISNAHNTIASQGADIATKLLQTGISESGLSSQLYTQILNANLTSDNQLGQALGTLAGAAARPTIQVNQPTATG